MNKNKERYKKWVVNLLIQLLFITMVIVAADWFLTRDNYRGTLPDLTLTTLNGETVSLKSTLSGGGVIHFWATWCPVCRLEQSMIDELAQDYPVITIAQSSGDDLEVTHYLNEQQLKFRVVNDQSGDLSRVFGVAAVPVSFIVNPAGEITSVTRGYSSSWGVRVRLWLAGVSGY